MKPIPHPGSLLHRTLSDIQVVLVLVLVLVIEDTG
jgi:hypothetical protein